jgi:hypothetical protein
MNESASAQQKVSGRSLGHLLEEENITAGYEMFSGVGLTYMCITKTNRTCSARLSCKIYLWTIAIQIRIGVNPGLL